MRDPRGIGWSATCADFATQGRLHGFILALWGMPLGEMIDLERVAELAKKNGKYTFFFTSAPANVVGGVSSHVNGTAIF